MIGKIKGKLLEIDGNIALIDTRSGLSYYVYITPQIATQYKCDSEVDFYTHFQVREDAQVLFAFETKDQYTFFQLLLTVSGVGPKTAYLIISSVKIHELIQAVKQNNIGYFTQIKGLGKKTSMKIILELTQKLKQDFSFEKMNISDDDKLLQDALISLGFKKQEINKTLSKISKDETIEKRIQSALKLLQ